MVTRGWESWKMLVNVYKLAVRREINSGDLLQSTVIIVSDTVLHTSKLLRDYIWKIPTMERNYNYVM